MTRNGGGWIIQMNVAIRAASYCEAAPWREFYIQFLRSFTFYVQIDVHVNVTFSGSCDGFAPTVVICVYAHVGNGLKLPLFPEGRRCNFSSPPI